MAAKLVYVPAHDKSGHPEFDLEIWILDWNTWNSPSSIPEPLEIDTDDYYVDSVSDYQPQGLCSEYLTRRVVCTQLVPI